MSLIIDYGQLAEDHQSLLVLVNQTGTLINNKTFNRAWERIHKCNCIGIPGQKRKAWVRYKRSYPKENNEWGDFQAHRKVLGLVSVGECSNIQEFEELFDCYKKVKEEYSDTLFNSRLIIFGMNRDGSPLSEEDKRKFLKSGKTSPVHSEDSGVTSDLSPTEVCGEGDCTKDNKIQNDPEMSGRPHSNSLTKESTGAEVVFFPCIDECPDLEEKLKEFVSSIFFVLDGKRLDRSFERADRMQLICAPFEKKDYVGLDTDTKSFRKKCQGRLRKHLADLCLQAGISGEAILHYETAIDILKPVNDWLWIGACFEGLCSASVILVYPRVKNPTLRRVESMSIKPGSSMGKETKIRAGSLKHNYTTNGLQELADPVAKTALNPADIIDKYRECILNYSKFKLAAVIELEACLKACRFLIQQRNLLQAADFLQNVVYINIQSTDEDKIDRYCTLSQLYTQLGFLRKAAFFRRIAAMQCVTPQNPRPNWQQCYHLMMQSLEGYKLIFDIKDIPDVPTYGWPIVQYRVLNELIYSAKRMGNIPLAVRHSTFLLQTLHKHLSSPEKSEIVSSLESLTARCAGTTQALALDNGVILPPLPLTEIPHVRSFRLVPAAPHLEPVKIVSKSASAEKDLFIYTPLSIGSNSTPEKTNKVDFRWVAKDICEVHLQVFNPMPEELKITQMGLLIEGVEMEMYPTNPVIPAESGPYLVKMLCRPKSHGELNILGYTTLVYGVHSNCRLKDIPHLHETQSKVEIIPPLPNVQVKSSFPQSAMFITESDGANVVTTASASLYAGQSEECLITVHNTSVQPVERVEVKLRCKSEEKMYFSKIFNWCSDNIKSQLPIQSSKKMCFSVCVSGHSDFLLSSFSKHSSTSGSEVSENTSAVIKDTVVHKCFETTLQIQYSGGEGLMSGFCRLCSIAFTVDILPSVIFVNWDVLPAEGPDHCVLVFDVKNVSGHQIEVQYTADQNVILEPEEVRRVSVQVERCIFPPEPEPSVDLKNTVIKHIGHSNHYSQFLASFVDIRWNIPSETCCGKASIEHLKWTIEQLELISVSQVSWDIRINDEMYTDTCNPEVLVGRLMLLDVKLTLKEDLEASEGELEVSCCSKVNCEIDSMCTLMGTDSLLVPNVDVSSAVKFSTSFLFHVSGHYTLDVKFTVRRTNAESIVFKCYKILLIVDEEDR
ncbi:trafficking protein particle complex subunit 9-like [Mytilus californianus]|uniref:trafficking protein particle complex subunit 9-like n=1 Tax=Mytilus californianus TaxID=6549 RepID=UPI002247882A|nr:trafficking protein particle complex subunit 9-like [Mytilus californianus]